MTIEKIKKRREALEKLISEDVAAFCEETGVWVSELNLERHEVKDARGVVSHRAYKVAVEVRI
jgi:hypothetical protein